MIAERVAATQFRRGEQEIRQWPEPIDDAAFYGLAGEIVRTIEPHSEADPCALLVQILVGIGSLIGPGPHFKVEADRHFTNEFVALVGKTSKARKGSSLGHVRRLLHLVDPAWNKDRVQSGLSSGEGLVWAVRDHSVVAEPDTANDSENRLGDGGVADKRLLVVESEFASCPFGKPV